MTTTRSTATGLFASVFPTLAGRTVHGNGRRGGPEFRIDAAELAAWTAANARARRAYQIQPNAVTREIFRGGYEPKGKR